MRYLKLTIFSLILLSATLAANSASAAISYVGGQVGSQAGQVADLTVNFSLTNGSASTPAAGDLVIVAWSNGDTSDNTLTIANSTGTAYTLAGSELYQNDTYDSNLRVAYRFMPATPETSVVIGGDNDTSGGMAWSIHVFRNVDPNTPLDVAAVTDGNINTRLVNPGPITPTTSGAWIYVAGGGAADVGGSYTASYLTDFRAANGADTQDGLVGSGYVTWTSGTYDPAVFTGGGTDTTNDSWTAVTLALRPYVQPTITVSGGCFTDATEGTACTDNVSSSTDAIKVAVNGVVEATSDTTVDGAWSFTINQPASGATMVFFRDDTTNNLANANEATTITKYDGSGNVDLVKMYENQLVIGTDATSANSDQTVANTDMDTDGGSNNGYENSDDEDVLVTVAGTNDLTLQSGAHLYVISGDTFRPASGGGADTTVQNLYFEGTFTTDNNAVNVAGDWTNAGTFTATTGTVTFNGTAAQTITSNAASFNTVTFNNSYGSSPNINYTGALTIGSNVTLSNATNIASTNNTAITISGTINGANVLSINSGSGAVTFGGIIGGSTPITSLSSTGSGTVTINTTAITTRDVASNTVAFTGPVTLGADLIITTNNTTNDGAITFSSTINGANSLTMNNGDGTVTFGGIIGGSAPISSIGTTGSGAVALNTTAITTRDVASNTVSFSGPMTLGANLNITTDNTTNDGGISLSSTINGAYSLTLTNGAGTVTLGGIVGGTTPITSLTVAGVGTTAINTTGITTRDVASNNVSFAGPITLGANLNITTDNTTNDGAITFSSTINGANTLTLTNGAGTVTLGGIVGGTTPITSLTVAGAGTTAINTTGITTRDVASNNVSFAGPVTLGAGLTITTNNATNDGTITFSSTINSADTTDRALTLASGGADISISGAIGATNDLASLTITGYNITLASIGAGAAGVTGATSITVDDLGTPGVKLTLTGTVYNTNAATYTGGGAGGGISVTGASPVFTSTADNITFTNLVTLGNIGSVSVATSGSAPGSGNINFATIRGNSDEDVTLNASSANVTVGLIGDETANEINTVALTGATILLNGNIYTSDAAGNTVTLTGAATLGAGVSIDTDEAANDGNINFTSTINSSDATDRALTLTTGTADISVTGAIGATNDLASFTITGNDITLSSDIGAGTAGVVGATSITSTDAGDTGILTLGGTVYNANAATYVGGSSGGISVTGASAAFTSTADNITFTNTTTLGNISAVSVTTAGSAPNSGNITFGTIRGTSDEDVTLNASSANVTVGLIGDETANEINTVALTGATILLNGDILTSDAAGNTVTLTGAVTLGAGVSINTDETTNDGNISFTSTINSTDATDRALTLTAGGADISVAGAIGATNDLASLTITGNDITLSDIGAGVAGVTGTTSLTGDATGTITLTGTVYNTAGTQAYNAGGAARTITLNAAATFTTTDDTIAFTGLVDSQTAENNAVTLNAGTAQVTFNNNVGATQSLGLLTKQGAGDLTFGTSTLAATGLTLSAGTINNAATDSGAWTVSGNMTISAGTLKATTNTLSVGGNWSNSGTFTANGGTVTLNSTTATQTVSGTLTGTSAFNNLTLTNTFGTNASDNERTGFVPGVDFNSAVTVSNNYTITTASVRVEYQSAATYEFANINWNGGAVGTRIFFRNSDATTTWLLKVTGTQTDVSYVNVSRSDASVAGGSEIDASNGGCGGTNYNALNNVNWNFGSSETVNVFYSVGDSSSNLMTGTPTLDITSGAGVFSAAQTGNIGVGDRVTYNTSTIAYIAAKTNADQMHWTLVTALGAPAGNVTGATVNSITHEYTNLNSALAGAGDANHTNNYDLTACGGFVLNIPTYYDAAADTTAVTITGYTTGAANYINIYTPNNTATEANQSQRHNGKWDDTKYRLVAALTSSYPNSIYNYENYVRLIGLQISFTFTGSGFGPDGIRGDTTISTTSQLIYDSLIVRGATSLPSGSLSSLEGMNLQGGKNYIKNSLVYNWNNNSSDAGIVSVTAGTEMYVYNSTVINNGAFGISNYADLTTVYAKNCGVYGHTNNFYNTITQTTNSTTTPTFVDQGNSDYHLSPSDTTWKNQGTNLSADATLPVTQDIDGSYRGYAFDIGADEVPTDFVSTICEGTGAGGDCANRDYATLSAWETDVNSNLAASTTRVYSGSLTGAITDGATVTLYRGGVSQSITATLAAKTSDQILLTGMSGTTPLNVVANDEWRVDASNLWTVTGTGDALGASPAAVAKIDGAWASADTTPTGGYNELGISAWTTSYDNHIKIYTTAAARHSGKWDTGKYRLEISSGGIFIYVDYVWIDGLQIHVNKGSFYSAIYSEFSSGANEIKISNNIIQGNDFGVRSDIGNEAMKIWNNIFYDNEVGLYHVGGNVLAYNNTLKDNYHGIEYTAGGFILKNNIFSGNTVNFYNVDDFKAGTDYNATDSSSMGYTVTGGGNTHDKVSQTFAFIDFANDDFHLASTDTAAKGAGVNLYADSGINVTIDIDGAIRSDGSPSFPWDIGADQTAIPIYRSVGPGATGVIDDDNSLADTLSISSSIATFEVAVSNNVGVGDAIVFDNDADNDLDASDSVIFITARTDSTHYVVQDQDGSTHDTPTTDNDKWAIYRAYTSLANAESGNDNDSSPVSFSGGDRDILTNNEQWSFAAYANGTTGDGQTDFGGWSTGQQNYLKIYTPVTSSEVGTSQRHQGKWDNSKYHSDTITASVKDMVIEGLQVDGTAQAKDIKVGYDTSIKFNVSINQNILKMTNPTSGTNQAVDIYLGAATSVVKASNNIIYDIGTGSESKGIKVNTDFALYAYNNTFANMATAIHQNAGAGATALAINNVAQNCTDCFLGTFESASDYNISNVAADAPGSHSKNSTTVSFVDAANKDFHLPPTDTAALDAGVNPFFAQDNFNRADESPLTTSHWTKMTFVPSANAAIVSNVATDTEDAGAGTDARVFWNSSSFDANQYGQMKINAAGGTDVGILLRANATTAYLADFVDGSGNGSVGLYVIGGSQVGSSITGLTFGVGDTVKAEIAGYTVTFYVNGTKVGSITDSAATLAAGAVGFTLDGLNDKIDDWQGGSMTTPFLTDDIDGQTRRQWDIGADEGSVEAAMSVMASGGDYSTLSLWEAGMETDLTSSATAVFSGTRTSTIADGAPLYLCRSGTYQSITGTSVHAGSTQALVESISSLTFPFASGDIWYSNNTCNSTDYFTLSNSGNPAIATAKIDGAWASANGGVTINGWTTGPNNYIRIYTEAAARHNERWDDNKFRIEITNSTGITLNEEYARIEGIQCLLTMTNTDPEACIYDYATGTKGHYFSNNLFKANLGASTGVVYGIRLEYSTASGQYGIWNNIIYDFTAPSGGGGLTFNDPNTNYYFYNNSFYNNRVGVYASGNGLARVHTRNNLFASNTTDISGFTGSANDNNYNATSNSSFGSGYSSGANDKVSQTFTFVDEANDDFHLSASDTSAKDSGTNLLTDSGLPVYKDIDGSYRGNAYDIGADEVPTEFVSTVMQSGGNYSTLSAWESDVNTDLTAATTRLYFGSLTGAITDGATVTLYRGGASQSITATLVAKSSTQILLSGITGTVPLNVQANDEWRVDASNRWTVTGTLDSLGASPIAVAKIDGAWSAADTTAVTVDGWTTSYDNYIKIYTTTAARHHGKWDDGRYRLDVSSGTVLGVNEGNVKIEGLQIKTSGADTYRWGINLYPSESASIDINSSIFTSTSSSNDIGAIQIHSNITGGEVRIWNNIIYNFNTTGITFSGGIFEIDEDSASYVYNNTFYNNTTGVQANGTLAKNNITQNCTDGYSGTFDSSSTNNITSTSYADAAFGPAADSGTTTSATANKLIQTGQNFLTTVQGGMVVMNTTDTTYSYVVSVDSDTQLTLNDDIMAASENYTIYYANQYKTVQFVDASNGDYRLAKADTAAQNAGADLSADTKLAFSTDIEGQTRPNPDGNTWDIGADEYYSVTTIYRSVGPGDTSNLNTGSATVTIAADGSASFSAALPDNIGVGDVLEYPAGAPTDVAIISGRNNSTSYTVQSDTGGAPTAAGAGTAVHIHRAYTSLALALEGTKNTAITPSLTGGNRNIVANNEQWNFACYANGSTVDTTGIPVSGWTTGATNYIKIYTPVSKTEVGTSQRHSGKWDANKYSLGTSGLEYNAGITEDYTKIEGLQIKFDLDSWSDGAISIGAKNVSVSDSIIDGSLLTGEMYGIYTYNYPSYIFNNLFYDFTGASTRVFFNQADGTNYLYNNTIYNCVMGFSDYWANSPSIIINNIVSNCTTAADGTFAAGTDYNATNNGSMGYTVTGGGNTHDRVSQTFSFADTNGKDFHLSPTDTGAKNYGVDLSNDADLAFSTDIDGQSRLSVGSWDIGADETSNSSTSTPTSPESGIGIGAGVNMKPGTNLHGGVWACGQDLVDSRDSKAYKTVAIGDQCWMKQGLNVGTRIAGTVTQDGYSGTTCTSIDKYCYDDTDANCDSNLNPNYPDGGIYQWDQAMCGSTTAGAQGICPSGWHLPTHDEFTTLERAVCASGTCSTDFPFDTTTTGWRGTDEGTKLKAGGSSGWEGNLAGYYSGGFLSRATIGAFWTSSEYDAFDVWVRNFNSGFASVLRFNYGKTYGFSVRCVKN